MKITSCASLRFLSLSLLSAALLWPAPLYAQLTGDDTLPGTPCAAKGALRVTANATGTGAYVLTCNGDSGQWVATINTATPTADEQVANKAYIDSVVKGSIADCADDDTALCLLSADRATSDPDLTADKIVKDTNILGVMGTLAGNDCTEIGDLCPADGTVFAGYHPILQVPLFIPSTDQGQLAWREPYNSDATAPASIDDGRANTDLILNESYFPAFKVCKDLTFGDHNDWYLPALGELFHLFTIRSQLEAKGNITNFRTIHYWSSTQRGPNNAASQSVTDGSHGGYDKAVALGVRCVRR